jgi:hypothetical protein
MAEIITGDTTKGIKSVGELALRISKFDSYRLFTLYENVKERKIMNVSGDQKYYLVFKSPKKEIRIPEYDPKGFFEVDKTNGCVLFKITKKNAEDILSMKTAGEKIFHIVRVFEEKDSFGRILNVTDEVEVYHGKWGDDYEFNTFTTENKVDLLTKALAAQVDKNAKLLNEYNDLLEKYNSEAQKTSNLEKEIEEMKAQIASLEEQLVDYTNDTYDGTILSTDTKYIAFENALDDNGVKLTEEQYSSTMRELLMNESMVTITDFVNNESNIDLNVGFATESSKGLYYISAKKNAMRIGNKVSYDSPYNGTVGVSDNDLFRFSIEHENIDKPVTKDVTIDFKFEPNKYFKGIVEIEGEYPQKITVGEKTTKTEFYASVSFVDENGNYVDISKIVDDNNEPVNIDSIGTLTFVVS